MFTVRAVPLHDTTSVVVSRVLMAHFTTSPQLCHSQVCIAK
jgi:hypothetical protein